MSERPSNKSAADRRVSLAGDDDVRYWTKELGVSKNQLVALLGEVGDSLTAIRRALDKPHLSQPLPPRPKRRPR